MGSNAATWTDDMWPKLGPKPTAPWIVLWICSTDAKSMGDVAFMYRVVEKRLNVPIENSWNVASLRLRRGVSRT